MEQIPENLRDVLTENAVQHVQLHTLTRDTPIENVILWYNTLARMIKPDRRTPENLRQVDALAQRVFHNVFGDNLPEGMPTLALVDVRRDPDESSDDEGAGRAPRVPRIPARDPRVPRIADRRSAQGYSATAYTIIDEDLNGECYLSSGEGENLVSEAATQVVFGTNTPRQRDGNQLQRVAYTAPQLLEFVRNNITYLRNAVQRIPEKELQVVAYLRYLAATNGLISPDFAPDNHHVDYNDAIEVTHWEDAQALTIVAPLLTDRFRAQLREMFPDLVCCVAYMFRVRGHHYMSDMEARYNSLFSRCLRTAADLPASWPAIARYALHAIYPDVLDQFWKYCVDQSFCAGTLAKRFDCAPAGSSGVLALLKGVKDIQLILPAALQVASKEIRVLENLATQIRTNRWGASINARYYGVPRIRVAEDDIGVLASVVMGVYERLAPTSELRNAPSVRRLATAAPATGGALGRIAFNTVNDERMRISAAPALPTAT